MDWILIMVIIGYGAICFLGGVYRGRITGGRCANTSTNSASDAIALLIRARDVILHGRDRSDNEPIVVSIDKFLTQRHA
jgi:hypothetical protein